jgi:pilus assembly protein CpaF
MDMLANGMTLPEYYAQLRPLDVLLSDDRVTEIMVNGANRIYVEMGGKLTLTPIKFPDNEALKKLIQQIASGIGRQIDFNRPLVDARLLDGSRVNAVIEPITLDGPSLTIRKFSRQPLTVADLVKFGTCTPLGFSFLEAAVLAHTNIVVVGGTGTGKTTLLNILSCFIPETERIVTIEDAAELQLKQDHVVRMESRRISLNGEDKVEIRDLVINALRMRPDRIVVGECRGGEALDMLQAMNTGHDGSMTTLHANTPRDAIARLETLVLMAGLDLPVKAIRQQIASAIGLLVQVNRLQDGSRRVTYITEITGMEGDVVSMQDIFKFEPNGADGQGRIQGDFKLTGIRPKTLGKLESSGIPFPAEIAASFPERRKNSAGAPGAADRRAPSW